MTCPNTDIDMFCNPNQSNVSHRMDVLGACNLCLDEGQVLGVGGGSSVEELKVDLLISHGTAVLLTEP